MNRILAALAAVLSGVVVLLATQSQTFSRVDADGTKVRMLIAGSESPTVVFETGAEGRLELWGKVPSEVSRFAKTISYDRAGNGLSETAVESRDGRHTATELHAALQKVHASPPYILVGHSLGFAPRRMKVLFQQTFRFFLSTSCGRRAYSRSDQRNSKNHWKRRFNW